MPPDHQITRSPDRQILLTCAALFLLSELIFLPRLSAPPGFSFDEVFYVPAARGFLNWSANLNRQHPPLGKYLIAAGMAIFGDNYFGWRIMSVIFGGLTVAGMYAWGRAIFRRHSTALFAALIALANQMLYIQARTAMLDIFLVCFLVWAMAAISSVWLADLQPAPARRLLFFAGAMFGLAVACKWSAVVPWALAFGLVTLVRSRPGQAVTGVSAGWKMLALVALPLAVYAATFLPLLWMPPPDGSLAGIWHHQLTIWRWHTTDLGPPVQASHWYEWALNWRAMQYFFERDGANHGRAVLLIGNPIVLWTGFAAAISCLVEWLRHRSRAAFPISFWYWPLYLSWALIPRRVSYFYYYYPAAMALSLALAYYAERWQERRVFGIRAPWAFLAAAALVFALLLPVSSAMRVPLEWIEAVAR